jgi:hypothetical protein
MMPADHRHLDDETLTAVLDGEASPEECADAAGCGACSTRLDRLGQVALALAAPTPPPHDDRRRATIDAAVRAGEPEVAPPTALASRRPRRVSPAWAVAAAVIASGALAIPLVDDLGGRNQNQERVAAGDVTDSSSGEALADQRALPGGGDAGVAPTPASERNLGSIDLNGLDELAASLRADVQQNQPLDLSAPGAAPTAEAARPDAEDESAGVGRTQGMQPCEEPARRRDRTLGPVTYAAQATFDGRPAVVLAFEVTPPEAPASIRLLVLAADGCDEIAAEP